MITIVVNSAVHYYSDCCKNWFDLYS